MKKLLFLAVFLPLQVVSQKLENLKAVAEGNKIVITYDITEGVTGDSYDVALYASHNNFSTPLQLVSGDIGKGLSEGRSKRIEWDAKTEIGDYRGQLSFEVKVEVLAVFSLLKNVTSAKRGKSVPVTWRGGNKQQDVKIELLKEGNVETTLYTGSNNGSYEWFVPQKHATGKDYQIRLSSGRDVITTPPFSVKHKIPTAVKVAPAALLLILTLPSQSSGESTQRTLPAPVSLNLKD